MQPYHRFVFDCENRQVVGQYEEMYASEDTEGYDSWFQEDQTHLIAQISRAILGRYNFGRILDVGTGKGTFIHLLKRVNNEVIGIDVSPTAISKAKTRYPHIRFETLSVADLPSLNTQFDLVVAKEVLSYVSEWPTILETIASRTEYIYISLYLPPDPIGYIKSFAELKEQILRHFTIETEILVNHQTLCILGKNLN